MRIQTSIEFWEFLVVEKMRQDVYFGMMYIWEIFHFVDRQEN